MYFTVKSPETVRGSASSRCVEALHVALPSPALTGLSLRKSGFGKLAAPGSCDLRTMHTSTQCTVYIEHVRWCCNCDALYFLFIYKWQFMPALTVVNFRELLLSLSVFR